MPSTQHVQPASNTLLIVVPYRDRAEHLETFLPHIASYFCRDKADKHIPMTLVVVEQADEQPFNRGWLLNVGVHYMSQHMSQSQPFGAVCLHDVDYLPIWADYSFTEQPTRLLWWGAEERPVKAEDPDAGTLINARDAQYFGGVVLFPYAQFLQINGYSNRYAGWGYEDSDLYHRCILQGLDPQVREGTFFPLAHDNLGYDITPDGTLQQNKTAQQNEARFNEAVEAYEREGITEGFLTLSYTVVKAAEHTVNGLSPEEQMHYTWLTVKG